MHQLHDSSNRHEVWYCVVLDFEISVVYSAELKILFLVESKLVKSLKISWPMKTCIGITVQINLQYTKGGIICFQHVNDEIHDVTARNR